jgi:hypothetical protein
VLAGDIGRGNFGGLAGDSYHLTYYDASWGRFLKDWAKTNANGTVMEWFLGLTAGLFIFGGLTKSSFEGSAARDIQSRLLSRPDGAVAEVRVSTRPNFRSVAGYLPSATIVARRFAADGLPLFAEPDRSRRGKLDRLSLQMEDFDLRGLRVAKLSALIPDCRFDFDLAVKRRQIRLSQTGEGTGEVQIAAESLEKFVLQKYPLLKTCRMTLENDRVKVTGEGRVGNSPLRFVIEGSVESADGRSLRITRASASINEVASSPGAAASLANSINPILHLDRDLGMYGSVDIARISLRAGMLIAGVRTRIPAEPRWVISRWRFR